MNALSVSRSVKRRRFGRLKKVGLKIVGLVQSPAAR
jgi:hypothetical protein